MLWQIWQILKIMIYLLIFKGGISCSWIDILRVFKLLTLWTPQEDLVSNFGLFRFSRIWILKSILIRSLYAMKIFFTFTGAIDRLKIEMVHSIHPKPSSNLFDIIELRIWRISVARRHLNCTINALRNRLFGEEFGLFDPFLIRPLRT